MQEVHEPAWVRRPDLSTPLDLARERAAAAPDHIAFRVQLPAAADVLDLTLPQFLERLDRIATHLLHLGVAQGERVAIMAATSFGWALAEWSIWRVGAVVVPVYPTAPTATIEAILDQTDARVLFVDDAARSELPERARHLTVIGIGPGDALATDVGVDPTDADRAALDARQPHRDDLCSIVFTSGTSGEPRGTMISHRNMVDLPLNVHAAWADLLTDRGSTVVFLPLAHILARGLQTVCLWAGMRISYVAEASQVIAALPQLQPTFLVVVPRILDKIRNGVRASACRSHLGAVWADAERVAMAWGRAAEERDRGTRPLVTQLSRAERIRHAVYTRLFYRKVAARLGGRIEFLLSGAAPLDPELSLLFRGMGIPVMEGYGLTESTAPATGNRPGHVRSGTVGQPVPGTTIRVQNDGEVWIRGIGVSPGYWGHDDSDDGWLRTGDIGRLDEGYLTITGRIKDVVVTSGGKTVSPARWTRGVQADARIAHVLVIGDNRPYLTALLVLDPDELRAQGSADPRRWPAGPNGARVVPPGPLHDDLATVVAHANQQVARSEEVKDFLAVVVDLSPEAGWVTSTLKLRRHVARERLNPLLDRFYDEDHQ